MIQPILHPRSKAALELYLKQATHGLLLSGKTGSGKLHIALWLAEQLQSSAYIVQSAEEKSTITIEQIRELYNATKTGNNLTVIIKNAHMLSIEAQNSFLKLLEEPPKNTKFILTSNSYTALLTTIRSRSQIIEILPPKKADLLNYAATSTHLEATKLQSLLHTTESLAGSFLKHLANEQKQTEHQVIVETAKKFYASDSYNRHLMCLDNKYEKDWALNLLNTLVLIIHSLLKNSSQNQTATKRLAQQAELLELTSHNLFSINGNIKIHLAKLSQQL